MTKNETITQNKDTRGDRNRRLADALKENLKRRKARDRLTRQDRKTAETATENGHKG